MLEGFGAFLLLELILLSGGEIADNDSIIDVDGTILGAKVFEVGPKNFSELEVFNLEVKQLIILLLKRIRLLIINEESIPSWLINSVD